MFVVFYVFFCTGPGLYCGFRHLILDVLFMMIFLLCCFLDFGGLRSKEKRSFLYIFECYIYTIMASLR